MAAMRNFLKRCGAVGLVLVALTALGGLGLSAAPAVDPPAAPVLPPGGTGGSACGIPSFAPPVTYPVALRPRSATVATLNADAYPDLVVTNYSANAISVLLGNGDGTFQPSVSYPVGVHPVAVAVGDFNEDTKPDLIVSNYDSANVSLLRGNGDGTFQGATDFPSGTGPYGVTAGDFNEDTHLDVAVSNVNFGNLHVMLGNGNGTLQGPVTYAAGLRPQVIATADFNSDNHLDLVVPNYTAATVSVLAGTGTGTFQAAVPYPVEDGPDYLTVADVNTDTHPDLLIPHYTTGNVSVLLGNGSGSFLPEVLYPAGGANPLFVAVADFDGDGVLDLATANYGSDSVSILRGNGDGTFQGALTFPVGAGTSPVAVGGGRFDADARLDLFAANENTNDVSIFISTCGLVTPTPTPPLSATPTRTGMPPPSATDTPGPAATDTPAPTGTATPPAPTPPPSATPTTCPVQFNDVPPGSTFYDYIQTLACRGIVGGYPCGGPGEPCPGTYFRPNSNVTRGQVSKIVSESAAFSDPVPSTQQTFEDVPPGSTFHLWIERLATRGIIGGYPCGGPFEPCVAPDNRPYFRPNNNVTRGQLSKITSGAAGWAETPTGQTFEDVPPGSTFYLWIERMAARAVISGYPCGGPFEPCVTPADRPYFRPNNNATRGQMAKIATLAFFPAIARPPPAR
jgi:hypothetical protein